jgi:hypothetical protein
MNQEIRNKLRNVVTQCRKLLEESVSQELEGKYGIFAKKDQVTADPNAEMTHLTEEEQAARKDILDHFGHIQARGFKAKEALDQLVREIAFTHLNRLCAYKMMEAREVYVGGQKFREAVSRGINSNGVKFYLADHPEEERLFNTGHQDVAYRHFLDWLGGLLSDEIGVLFNPNDPANRLYPRQKTLDEVLGLLNHGGIKPEEVELREKWPTIWSQDEDETIGWVYQYFTPKELRDQARKESQAPQNSYELAFRNQFFTPRYVVEFLTDNTLGRLWYEMRRGDTKLTDQCRYMVRRSTEIFLEDGEQPPKVAADERDDVSQEELLQRPVHIPYRNKKDPRELKILDPACGSGHFLLYCFDLLLTIYEEAYTDPDLGSALQKEYPKLDDLRRDVPQLILSHNVHGIDIDVRASQIAALALWLRCQRAYREMGLKKDRPKITRSNFVCAEAMPGEEQMLKDFVGQLEPKVLGQIVEVVFDKMKLAGEAGSLLKIEEEIRDAVARAKKQWARETTQATDRKGQPLLFTQTAMDRLVVKPEQASLFDLSGITDHQFFEQAETKVIDTLREYAERAHDGQRLQRRLFTEDAMRGFAFVDLCQKRYDVMLMNPPFGECIESSKAYLNPFYPESITDLGMMFVSRGADLLAPDGACGAITNRTCLATSQLEQWRRKVPLGHSPVAVIADLGYGVLDAAKVEAAAYTIWRNASFTTLTGFRLLDSRNKGSDLHVVIAAYNQAQRDIRTQTTRHEICLSLPLAAIVYWAPQAMTRLLMAGNRLCDREPGANDGGHTGDDFRFVRAVWEIPPSWIGRSEKYVFFAKGGEYSPFWDDCHLLAKWENNAHEIRQLSGARIYHEDLHFIPGLTYPLRTTSDFSPRVLPRETLFSTGGHGIHFRNTDDALVFLSLSYTRFIKVLVEILFGSGDASVSGSMARNYTAGTMSHLPLPTGNGTQHIAWARQLVAMFRNEWDAEETSRYFYRLPIKTSTRSLQDGIWDAVQERLNRLHEIASLVERLEATAAEMFGVVDDVEGILNAIFGIHPCSYEGKVDEDRLAILLDMGLSELMDAAANSTGGRNRSITMKSYFIDRQLDLCCHALSANPKAILESWKRLRLVPRGTPSEIVRNLLSQAVGVAFGRWDMCVLANESHKREQEDVFAALPTASPAMLATTSQSANEQGSTSTLPIQISREGILPEAPESPDDIVRRVQAVFEAIWHQRGNFIESEACEILGVKELREYFRKPGKGGFWDDHISQYSKSRRKAPIYWLLQSSKKSYALWLYYHRLDKDLLFKALVNCVEPKIRLETNRLETLLGQKAAAGQTGKEAKRIAKEVERQEDFLSELRDFEDKLRRVANLHLEPDLNDGVVLNIAPLHELVPWNDAKSHWEELLRGKYEWSSIGKQLRQKGLVK